METAATMRSATAQATLGLRDAQTWRATGYVIVSVFSLQALFLLALAMLAVALPLALVGVGVPLLIGTFATIDRLIGVERRRAAWVGNPIAARPLAAGSIRSRVVDGVAWRQVGFSMIGWFVAALLCALILVVWAVPLFLLSIPLWAWAVDTSWTRMVVMPLLGAALLCVAPWGARGVGWMLRRFVEVQVGPDRIAEMQHRVSEVTESRSELLHAVAGERRRIERNLHDGVQQRLVALGIDLGLAESKLDSDPAAARELLASATRKTRESIGELRTIGRGLHPAILGDRGLDAALSAVIANSSIPVELRVDLPVEPPPAIAEAAYFVVSEAITNVMKHSQARLVVVDARSTEQSLTLSIYDDGRGGASQSGTGLAGIAARVRGFNGSFELSSPIGGPTVISVTLPLSPLSSGSPGMGR